MTRHRPALAGLMTLALLSVPLAGRAADSTLARFPSLDAQRTMIAGDLHRPAGETPRAAVVMMHGCSGLYTKTGRMQVNLAAWFERFAQWGYVVLAVDGFTPRGFRSMCETGQRPLDEIDDRPFDAYGALAWLSRQPFVRADRIALVGWSNGAMATLSAIDAPAPAAFGSAGPRFRAAAAFYPGCIRIARREGWRPYAPLLVMVGLADDWTQPRPCIRLIERVRGAGAPAEIVAFEGAWHAFDHPSLATRTRSARNDAWRTAPRREVHIGSDPAARAELIRRLRAFLAAALDD